MPRTSRAAAPDAASAARLQYSTDATPGITRALRHGVTVYRQADGRAVRDRRTLDRIASLAIPPAWADVWICAAANGHLQATGRDARRRKQYLYHPAWVVERDADKFDSLGTFAAALPRIRRAVRRDIAEPGLGKTRVLAAVVQLMDRTFIRVGGERHRRDNGSFGLTTLRNRHARTAGVAVTLDFVGKSGQRHRIRVEDARVARVVRRCLDLPGQVLFQYVDGDEVRSISAQDVNDYLRDVSRAAITSKDFRTWGGTVCAAAHLARCAPAASKHEVRRNIRDAIKAAAAVLGNTPAVCRRSYVAPAVIDNYAAGHTAAPRSRRGLRRIECAVLGLLAPAVTSSPGRRRERGPAGAPAGTPAMPAR